MSSKPTLLLLACALASACGGAPEADETFDQSGKFLVSDAVGRKALPATLDRSTEVWAVTTIWGDTTSAAAKAAGMAWGANSGLRWDEKFSRWVDSLPATTGEWGTKTYLLTTPYGKTL